MAYFPYHLVPAYGRDYRTLADLKKDLYAGKDFVLMGMGPDDGRYCSVRDIQNGTKVQVRWNRWTETSVITIKKEAK